MRAIGNGALACTIALTMLTGGQGGQAGGIADAGAEEQFEIPGGCVVEVARRDAPRPTLLVSDETADEGAARVRRLRFFQPDDADEDGGGELVSDYVQTEMLLRRNGRVDARCLRQHYHCLMVAALSCHSEPAPVRRVAMLGHGAGALGSFLGAVLHAAVTAVDSDAEVVALGRQHFDDCAHVVVGDAADFVRRQTDASFDAVLVDINAVREPLAAPPARMLSPDVVRALARATSMVVVNVLGDSEGARWGVASAFASEFAHVLWLRSPLCTNHVLVAGRVLVSPSLEGLEAWMSQQERAPALVRALAALQFGSSVLHQWHLRQRSAQGKKARTSEGAVGTRPAQQENGEKRKRERTTCGDADASRG